MELKLKKRELKITLVGGEVLIMDYPSKGVHDEYLTSIIAEPNKENELTLTQPDLYDIGMILKNKKKS